MTSVFFLHSSATLDDSISPILHITMDLCDDSMIYAMYASATIDSMDKNTWLNLPRHVVRHTCLTLGAKTRVWRYQGRFCPVALGLAAEEQYLITTSPWMKVSKGNHPHMAELLSLVKYAFVLPRYIIWCNVWCIPMFMMYMFIMFIFIWCLYDDSMLFLWFSMMFLWWIHDVNMMLIWCSHDVSMMFICFFVFFKVYIELQKL